MAYRATISDDVAVARIKAEIRYLDNTPGFYVMADKDALKFLSERIRDIRAILRQTEEVC
jgi:hypothetical protein